jgi:hypothetical protein
VDARAQLVGQAEAERLGASREALGLGAALDGEEGHEAVAGVDAEEEVEERHLGGLGGEEGVGRDVHHGAGAPGRNVALLPLLQGERVPLGGTGGGVGALAGHSLRQPVQLPEDALRSSSESSGSDGTWPR